MPQIANWPTTPAEAQAILESHPEATPNEIHHCKICGDQYWCPPNPSNGRFRSFCSKRCYHRHHETNPSFQRYRQSDKGKAMRQRVLSKSASRPEAIARRAQRQRWERLVLTLDRSQRPFDTTPWPTCTTDGCHNINSRRNFTKCTQCTWKAALERAWRNAGKPCVVCSEPLTRYQHILCHSEECKREYQRTNPDRITQRRIVNKRRRARKRAAFVEDVDVTSLLRWQKGRCYHCNHKIDIDQTAPHPKSLTLDHLIPLALGGDHSYANTVASCWKCNCSIKGVRAIGEQLKLV